MALIERESWGAVSRVLQAEVLMCGKYVSPCYIYLLNINYLYIFLFLYLYECLMVFGEAHGGKLLKSGATEIVRKIFDRVCAGKAFYVYFGPLQPRRLA